MINLRGYQQDMIDRLRGQLGSDKRVLLESPTGCHEKGHPILMFDGSIKAVEAVVVGDFLMGPDGLPRRVTELHAGEDDMFLVTPSTGKSFRVNAGHIFSLYLDGSSLGARSKFIECAAEDVDVFGPSVKRAVSLHGRSVQRHNSGAVAVHKHPVMISFQLTQAGRGEYYGFSLDGDRLYLDGNFIVHHNSGKTAIAVHMMSSAAAKGNTSMFLVHQGELLRQTSGALWKQRLPHGMICPGKSPSKLPAQVASVQTLVRRLDKYEAPDLIIIDEAHRSLSTTYTTILEAYPNAFVVGLTATPQRTDGRGLGDIYTSLVDGPSISWLIEHGYLCDYAMIAPSVGDFDLSGLKSRGGDYEVQSLEEMLNKPTITGDAIAEYKRHATGKRCVTMCVSIKHANLVSEAYNAAGVPSKVIEGKLSDTERQAILDDFRDGKLLNVCNVQLLVEGVDIPSIEVVQWLRPTQSLIIWMQGNGRGLRPMEGKEKLLILDHVKNWKKHGFPDEDRMWSLDSKKRNARKKEDDETPVNMQQCDACFAVFKAGPSECPACLGKLEVKAVKSPEIVDGELVELSREEAKRHAKIERGMARSIPDLVALGVKLGYQKPAHWAAMLYASRQKRPVAAHDFAAADSALIQIKLGPIQSDGCVI